MERTFLSIAYPLAFSFSILIFTLFSWYCGLVALPIQLAIIPFAVLFLWNILRAEYSIETLKVNILWDIIFLIGFFFILMVRFVNPTISYAEKFMDHAFIASIMRMPIVPPLDPWYANGTMNVYYYLGYWMLGSLGIITGVPSTIVFNLALPTLFALILVNGYIVGYLLSKRFQWLPLLTFFIVNPSFIFNLVIGNRGYSLLWESTRTISHTINEYPLFSMLWGDVHPHVIGIFNQVLLLALLIFTLQKWRNLSRHGRLIIITLSALSLGSMPLINTWDILVYAPIVVLFGVLLYKKKANLKTRLQGIPAGFFVFLVLSIALLLYIPFYLDLHAAGILGIAIVHSPSDPLQFILVHGFFIVIYLGYCSREIKERPHFLLLVLPIWYLGFGAAAIAAIPLIYLLIQRRPTITEILAVLGLLIIILTEIIYLQDSFGNEYYRMNTVFKFYISAWILMGISAFMMLAQWFEKVIPTHILSRRSGAIVTMIVVSLLITSPFILNFNYLHSGGTLDGMAYLYTTNKEDAHAINFLRTLGGIITLVEAEGGDYSYFGRVSSFTGIPTIIGWPFHEIVWRGERGNVTERIADVRTLYEDPTQTLQVMKKYNATLLYVGGIERERYRVAIPDTLLTPYYSSDNVAIYRLVPN